MRPMTPSPRSTGRRVLAAGAAAIVLVLTTAARTGPETAFLAANTRAMDRMMSAMEIRPTGDIDQDFVAMMEPHHQGAVEMAQAELQYGHNEQLRRIAQGIIVEQRQEIVAMRLATGRPLPDAAAANIPQPRAPQGAMAGMDMNHHP
ncbi:MAG: DUF305 domain-containing protein [Proteobacteria bacterium]|nr:DUF305 domain-containing protein [Pseudomonadota bacterium]